MSRSLSIMCRALAMVSALVSHAVIAHAVPPRLVVLVSIDQFPRDYLDRFGGLFPDGGFRRLVQHGADYRECDQDHLGTSTAPGHSVLLTGAYPVHTGVVDNSWYSRTAGREVGCVENDGARIVRSPSAAMEESSEPGVAPPSSLSTTVGDALRLATGMRAHVISAAIKERAAVLMGGQRPDGAYWFDTRTCSFVTSTYYREDLPSWVTALNAKMLCRPYLEQSWTKLRADVDYTRYADIDDAPYERPLFGLGRVFPHAIKEFQRDGGDQAARDKDRFTAVIAGPAGNEILLQLVAAAIDAEQLGRDEIPDLLTLGFSSNDLVGHAFGPQSQEVLDMTLRTDRIIAELLALLDAKVGRNKWLLIVTSDHGIAPVPEYLEAQGVLAPRADHYRRAGTSAQSLIEHALLRRFLGTSAPPPAFHNFIAAWLPPFVYMNADTPRALPGNPSFDEVLDAAREEITKLDGVRRVYVRRDRAGLAASADPFERRVYRSWHEQNGGDLVVLNAPYWLDTETMTTTHGTPYRYDTHVPLLLYGPGVRAGHYDRSVAAVDLAPTLARILGVMPPPMNEGSVLFEALAE